MKILLTLLFSINSYAAPTCFQCNKFMEIACPALSPTPIPPQSPTPKPSPTPTPKPLGCKDGYLPKKDLNGQEYWGYQAVSIGDREVKEFCFDNQRDNFRVEMDFPDKTGAAQCSWTTMEVTAPDGKVQRGVGQNNHYGYIIVHGIVPRGVYHIKLTGNDSPNCNDVIGVTAHY